MVIVLAAEDQESHMKVLRDIMTLFEKDKAVDELTGMDTPQEILAYFERRLAEAYEKE